MMFELPENKFHHKIEHYNPKEIKEIIIDEQFLLEEDDDQAKLYQELMKKS